jgi:hypothetical protein
MSNSYLGSTPIGSDCEGAESTVLPGCAGTGFTDVFSSAKAGGIDSICQ